MTGSKPLHCRCIGTGCGDTYIYRTLQVPGAPFDPDTIPAIGTWQCSSCVAVYMKLSPTTCFFAHINATFSPPDYFETASDEELYDLRVVTSAQGVLVRNEVLWRLVEESTRMDWPPVGQIEKVVLACPVLVHPCSGATLSGEYVVQAVRAFLGRRNLPVDTGSEGFVVAHETGEVCMFSWSERVEAPQLPDNKVDFVAHDFSGSESAEWFLDIGMLCKASTTLDWAQHVWRIAQNMSRGRQVGMHARGGPS